MEREELKSSVCACLRDIRFLRPSIKVEVDHAIEEAENGNFQPAGLVLQAEESDCREEISANVPFPCGFDTAAELRSRIDLANELISEIAGINS